MGKKHLKPKFYDDDDDVAQYLAQNHSDSGSDDEMETLSFGSLKSAQSKLDKLEQKSKSSREKTRVKSKKYKEVGPESDSSDESEGFFDEGEDSEAEENTAGKKKSKHAPKEASSKKRVRRIRQIPGLENKKQSSLYTDIRFDAAFGKANAERVRKDYAFLDEYRQSEIQEIDAILKNDKVRRGMRQREIQDLEYEKTSLKSRLDSLKNKELQQKVLTDYKKKINEGNTGSKFYLKKSEQRKIIQKHKFDSMKASQREKVIERKRKRRLGREFKQLEFNKPRD